MKFYGDLSDLLPGHATWIVIVTLNGHTQDEIATLDKLMSGIDFHLVSF